MKQTQAELKHSMALWGVTKASLFALLESYGLGYSDAEDYISDIEADLASVIREQSK